MRKDGMSINPVAIRAERHTEVGQLVQGNIDILLETWAYRAIEEQPEAKRVHHETLLDHLRDFLLRVGKSLAEAHESSTKQHFLPATQHGEQRWAAGWSLIEVVRDFQILRLVILEFLDKNLGRPLHSREILAIGLALDEAIGASVFMYVKGKDEYLHQFEKARAAEQEQTAQRLQEQAEALRLADQRKNEFLAMLGHELRNPLAPIRHALQIFDLKGLADVDLQRGQEVIRRQVEHLTRMVDDLLDVSRITLGKLTLQKETVAVSAIVSTALETIRPLAEAKHHQLIVDVPGEEIFLHGDRLRLSQVFINLLTNAAKYTDRGGRILLTVTCRELQVTFRVRDNGTGISADLLPHIFDPFTQEERAVNRANGGLGIGLSLRAQIGSASRRRRRWLQRRPGKRQRIRGHAPSCRTRNCPRTADTRRTGCRRCRPQPLHSGGR